MKTRTGLRAITALFLLAILARARLPAAQAASGREETARSHKEQQVQRL
jgi:hypothetical protein